MPRPFCGTLWRNYCSVVVDGRLMGEVWGKTLRWMWTTVLLCLSSTAVFAAETRVAVAANFTATMQQLVTAFERHSGHRVLVSYGSSGKLYAQIVNGAPFELYLSADDERPQRLEQDGMALAGSRFTYAVGRLALWSAEPGLVDGQGQVLSSGGFQRLAVANAKTAPYGVAALEVLNALGLRAVLISRLVYGESIAQTYQFVATGNAELGLVALAQVEANRRGSWWVVPAHLHAPLRQQAVLLERGKDNAAATALHAYLQSAEARGIIKAGGYDVE